MMKTFIHPRTAVLAAMIVTAGAWRLLVSAGHTPLSNFTPVGAMAIFGGCYFANRWQAYGLPLITLWLSDLLLSYFMHYHEWKWFYEGFVLTYGCFALMVFIGTRIRQVNVKNLFMAGAVAALAHWLITDLGVWLDGRMYPQTAAGLTACYVAALPYLVYMLSANLVFIAILFGSFELAQRKFPVLALQQTKS